MSEKAFKKFTISELKVLRDKIIEIKTKEELLEIIDRTIIEKEKASSESLNARFSVDWFNIDRAYIDLLHANGIHNVQQLREVEDIRSLRGITQVGYSQISWARDFFDMTELERIPPEKRTTERIIKKAVSHAQKCYKKHSDI